MFNVLQETEMQLALVINIVFMVTLLCEVNSQFSQTLQFSTTIPLKLNVQK